MLHQLYISSSATTERNNGDEISRGQSNHWLAARRTLPVAKQQQINITEKQEKQSAEHIPNSDWPTFMVMIPGLRSNPLKYFTPWWVFPPLMDQTASQSKHKLTRGYKIRPRPGNPSVTWIARNVIDLSQTHIISTQTITWKSINTYPNAHTHSKPLSAVLSEVIILFQTAIVHLNKSQYEKTRNAAVADKPRDAFIGQSRSPNMVPFYMLGMVSY